MVAIGYWSLFGVWLLLVTGACVVYGCYWLLEQFVNTDLKKRKTKKDRRIIRVVKRETREVERMVHRDPGDPCNRLEPQQQLLLLHLHQQRKLVIIIIILV